MANIMKWSSVGLLMVMLPSMVPAAVFNWKRVGEAVDNILRFEPRTNGQESAVTRPHPDNMAAPAFCNKLDCPKFKVIEKGKNYQLREYIASGWVSTTSVGVDFKEAEYTDFMRLFDYISGENVQKRKIAMTAPVLNRIIPGQGPACADNFTMSFFMSPKEDDPPKPSKESVFLSGLPKMRVYVRSFPGFASKKTWLEEAQKLAKDLEGKEYDQKYYYTAGYNSPFQLTDRHNEIWFIAKKL